MHFNRVFHCFHHPFLGGFLPLFLVQHPSGNFSRNLSNAKNTFRDSKLFFGIKDIAEISIFFWFLRVPECPRGGGVPGEP